ncbi:hypothetical protein L596_013020 [Steinernema carpocapsae]|uniref:BTB domain-containing protein n=1 Tax=Steinernema carpocapsae TaxID=34508 RepID=A0A4U5NYU5_STECR|nr:hypothetical protein L596_013020 [Steinernema carpocapsae]
MTRFSIYHANQDPGKQVFEEIGDFNWLAKHSSESEIVFDEEGKEGSLQAYMDVTCQPKNSSKQATLWSCLAKVTFLRLGGVIGCLGKMVRMNRFSNKEPNFRASTSWKGKRGKPFFSFVAIDIVESSCLDLSDRNNPLIESPDDAAQFKIGGVEMYLTKKVLSSSSPFFHTMFTSDFKEKAEDFYVLKDIKPNEFLHFLDIIHALDVSVDKASVESLLYLGDFFQCKLVTRLCEEFLLKVDEDEIDWMKKIVIGDRYKLTRVLLDAMCGVSKGQWKNFYGRQKLSYETINLFHFQNK